MEEELTQAYQLLKTYQPNVFLYRSEAELEAIHAQIKADIRPNNDLSQAYLIHARMMAAICDMHTYVSIRRKSLALPVQYFNLEAKYWPMGAKPLETRDGQLMINHAGKVEPVSAIEGIDQAEVNRLVGELWPKDGCLVPNHMSMGDFTEHYAMVLRGLIGQKEEIDYRYVPSSESDQPSEKPETQIKAISYKSNSAARSDRTVRYMSRFIEMMHRHGFEDVNENRENFFINRLAVYSVKLDTALVWLRRLERITSRNTPIRKLFMDVMEKNPDYLILDLTQSGGGALETARQITVMLGGNPDRLVTHDYVSNLDGKMPENYQSFGKHNYPTPKQQIKYAMKGKPYGRGYRVATEASSPYQGPVYRGKLYILVGPHTASASAILAAELQRTAGATLIGLPNSASTRKNCSAASGAFKMPYSYLDLVIPTLCGENIHVNEVNQGRLTPDVVVDAFPIPSTERLFAAMNYALDQVQKSNSAKTKLHEHKTVSQVSQGSLEPMTGK